MVHNPTSRTVQLNDLHVQNSFAVCTRTLLISGCLTSPNPLEVLVSVTGESPQPGKSSYGRQLSRLAGLALANRYRGMYAGVLQVGRCPIDIWPDFLPSIARWTFGSILLEKEADIYLRMVSGFSVAKERFGVLKEQECQRDLRRLMTTMVETTLKGTLTDLCARDMCAQKHYDAFSHSKRRRVLVETLAEYFLEETSSAVESLPTGDRVCHDASSESAEES